MTNDFWITMIFLLIIAILFGWKADPSGAGRGTEKLDAADR
jgi:hypothetical protein